MKWSLAFSSFLYFVQIIAVHVSVCNNPNAFFLPYAWHAWLVRQQREKIFHKEYSLERVECLGQGTEIQIKNICTGPKIFILFKLIWKFIVIDLLWMNYLKIVFIVCCVIIYVSCHEQNWKGFHSHRLPKKYCLVTDDRPSPPDTFSIF